MSDFAKQFLIEDPRRLNAVNGRQVLLSAFGKHPGWPDYFDLGDFDGGTRTSYWAKTVLHLEGFAKRSDAFTTDKQNSGVVLPHDFVFLWQRGDQSLIGRFWPSRDTSSRAYPIFVCFHCLGLPLDWVLEHALPRLEVIQHECASTQSAVQVKAILEQALFSLRNTVAKLPVELPPSLRPPPDRDRFLAHPDLGEGQRGMLNVLHHVRSEMASFLSRQAGGKQDWSDAPARRVRVPLCGLSLVDALLLWSRFFSLQVSAEVPRLFTIPIGQTWLDLTVGQPKRQDLFTLLHSLEETPAASTIPYQLDDYVNSKGPEIIMAFRTGAEPPKSGTTFFSKREKKTTVVEAVVKPEAAKLPPTKPARSGKPWWLIGGSAVAVLGALAVFSRGGKITSARPEAQNAKTEAQTQQGALAKLEQDFKVALDGARAALGQKDYARVIAQADVALKFKPGDLEVQKLKTEAQTQQGALAKSEQDFKVALDGARAALEQKDYARVIAQADVALKFKPGDLEVQKLKTEAQTQQGALAKSEQDFKVALDGARAALEQKDYARVIAQADVALKFKPGDLEAQKLKTEAQTQQGALAKLEQDFKVALDGARAALEQKDYAKVIAQADVALKFKPGDLEAQKLKTEAQTQQGALAKLEQDFKVALDEARRALEQKDYAKAITQADAALKFKPGDLEAQKLKTEAQTQQGALAKLEQDFKVALDGAQAALAQKDYAKAMTQADTALRLKPNHAEAQKVKSEAQTQQEAPAKLEQDFRVALDGARVALGQKDYARAIAQADVALRLKPNQPEAQKLKTEAQTRQGVLARSGTKTNSAGMTLVWIPNLPGTKDGGWVGKYEVTQGQYQRIMGSNPSAFSETAAKFKGYDWRALPVENVTLQGAREFCAKLTRKDASDGVLPAGFSYRLPTTNQWDYYLADAVIDSSVTSFERPRKSPAPVGQSPANRFGLYDVVGNVWEWCCEPKADLGMLKGLGFNSVKGTFARYPQPIERVVFSSTNALPFIGFRCVLTPDAEQP